MKSCGIKASIQDRNNHQNEEMARRMRKKNLVDDNLDWELLLWVYKELQKLNIKNYPTNWWANELNSFK